MIEVSAGIIICENKILIARRKHNLQNDLWEFPGGKLEPGETMPECLKREIREELEIEIQVGEFFMDSTYDYDNGCVHLCAYYAYLDSPQIPHHWVHSQLRWVAPSELDDFAFSPADIPIKDALKSQPLPTF